MGLDIGNRRIGVSLADSSLTIASPLDTLNRTDLNSDLRMIESKVEAHSVDKIVVGLPLESDGGIGRQGKKVQRFVSALSQHLPNIEYIFWDERMSTRIAQAALLEANTRRMKRKQLVDKIAAAVILQGWLDAQAKAKQ